MEFKGFDFGSFNFEETKKENAGQVISGTGFSDDWGLSLDSFFGSNEKKQDGCASKCFVNTFEHLSFCRNHVCVVYPECYIGQKYYTIR